MGIFDSVASDLTGGLIGGGNGPLSGVIGGNVSGAIHDVSSGLQTAGMLGADYYTGGLSSFLDPALSKGAQSNLGSPVGMVAQLGTGLAGFGVGSDTTGIPSSPLFSGASSTGDASAVGGSNSAGVGTAAPYTTTDPATGQQVWHNGTLSDGSISPAAPPGSLGSTTGAPPTTGAAAGASTGLFGDMSAAQKIALGLTGANTIANLAAGKKTINTDPYGVGAASGATATSMLQKFNTGQLMPSDQAGIAQYQDQATAAAKDYYAKAGLGDSSMAQQAIAQVGVQADQMRQAALNNMYSQAIQAAGVSDNYAQSAVMQAVAQNQQLMAAQSGFTNLMMQYGMYSGGQPVTKATGATK